MTYELDVHVSYLPSAQNVSIFFHVRLAYRNLDNDERVVVG